MLQSWQEPKSLADVADGLGMLAGALTTIDLQPWKEELDGSRTGMASASSRRQG